MSSLLAATEKTYPASLLLNFDGSFSDSSTNNHTVTNTGGTTISTSIKKYGSGAGNFASGSVSVASSSLFAFNSDFTIEGWFYFNTNNVGYQPLICADSGGDATAWALVLETNNTLNFYGSTGSGWPLVSNTTYVPPINEWLHIAIVRKGSNLSIYVNGFPVPLSSSTGLTTSIAAGTTVRVGGYNYFPDYARTFNGYIDDIRIVKGFAVYDGQFSPPLVPLSKNAILAPKTFNHIVMISTKSSGDITGYVSTNSGYYTVSWWDGTKTTYVSGASFAKSAIGGSQIITIYPSTSAGSLSGYFYNVDISDNNLTSVRAFYSKFTMSAGTAGYWGSRYFGYPYYYSRYTWIPGIPGVEYHLNISSNSLDSSALNQLYSDLLNGNGSIEVSDNTGVDSDNPSIATAKGYSVYGSLSPSVSALFNFDSDFSDSGGNNVSLTTYGTSAINTTIKKYGAGSAFFDSSGDYAQSASSTHFGFGRDNFTIEFWIYKISDGNTFHGIVCIGQYTDGILFRHQPNSLFDSLYIAGTAYNWLPVTNCPTGQWNHIAIVRENGYFKVYANGSNVLSAYNNADLGSSKVLTIGASSHGTGEGLNGYIDGLKIVKGKALYSDDFIVSSAAPTTSTSTVSPGVTRLLLNCNGSNNSTTFTDSSSATRTVTRTNTVISTAQSKFGGASAYFSNSGTDALAVTDIFNLSNTDYTIEFWFYLINQSGATGNARLFSLEKSGQSWGVLLVQNTPNFASYNLYGTGTGIDLNNTSFSYATWYHFAMTKDYDTYRFFLNGSLIGSGTGNYTPTGNIVLTIGGSRLQYNYNKLNGYIDDFRIITGKALYTSNFTPPSSQLAVYP